MKLRFYSNTLRFRLSRSEVARLAETGRVEESISFPQRELAYAIELGASPEITASFDGARIRVEVPREQARSWIGSGQAGIETPGGSPKILIEKDFQCLHKEGAEQVDAFPNPLMDKF
jgi:hypothetical protein